MAEAVKFSEEEMKTLKTIQEKYLEIQNNLGQVQVSLLRVSQQRDNLLSYEDKMKTQFFDTQEEEKTFIDKITEKYGDGELNPTTGEFTPHK